MPITHVSSLANFAALDSLAAHPDQLQDQLDALFRAGSLPSPHESGARQTLVTRINDLGAEEALMAAIKALESTVKLPNEDYRACWVIPARDCARHFKRPLFELRRVFHRPTELAQGWMPVILWNAESATRESLEAVAREQLYVYAHLASKGPVGNLMAWLTLQARALSFAGVTATDETLAAAKTISSTLRRYYNSSSEPELVACLHGDAAANALGFAPLGFPPDAGKIACLVFS